MVEFDEEQQQKQIERLHQHEQEKLAKVLSEKYDLPYTDLSNTPIETDALRLVDEEKAREAELAPFKKVSSTISVALKSPKATQTKRVIDELEERGYEIKPFMVSENSLDRAWGFYEDISYASRSKSGMLDVSSEKIKEKMEEMENIEDVKKETEEILGENKAYKTSRIVEIIFAGALTLDASDVHIEPAEENVRLRFRLDGVLHNVLHVGKETYELLRSRLKLLSGLKLNVEDRPQDGRFSIKLGEKDIEIRTSAMPGNFGESIVMRILDPESIQIGMKELGMNEKFLEIVHGEIQKPHGMILVTGPTGSGKTTSLYSFLQKTNEPETKIITIENPVEYQITGIVQTQTKEGEYTFLQGLRSALRQDPDVIMLGEIRDEEVAETAINAALTGHLVYSTLHTNTAAGSFPRLTGLNVSPKVLGSAINLVMAQRLVRRLCDNCKEKVKLEGENKEVVEKIVSSIEETDSSQTPENQEVVYKAVGCKKCNNIGYSGRMGIYEAILMDDKIEKKVRENPSENDIKKAAEHQGILDMTQDGMLKVLQGITSLEELDRVIELPEPENYTKNEAGTK